MRRTILWTSAVSRMVRKYLKRRPQDVAAVQTVLHMLEEDAFQPKLQTHKLKGRFDGSWACSAGYDLRIVFDIVTDDGVEVILPSAIGSHDAVY